MSIKIPFNPEQPISIVVFEGEATFVAQAELYQDNWSHWEQAVWMQCRFTNHEAVEQDLVFFAPSHPSDEILVEKVAPEVVELVRAKQAIWLWIDPRGTPLASLAVHID